MTTKFEEQAQMVQDLMVRESKLTDWERGFIDNIENQIAKGRMLTVKQADVLDKIWERVT